MSARHIVVGVAVVLSAAALAACSDDDPDTIASRGADEVARHSATRWARLTVDGLSEAEYHVAPAFVAAVVDDDPLGFERDYGTTFAQRFGPAVEGDAMVMLRDDIMAHGGLMTHRGCSEDDPTKRLWSFVVESSGDVMSLHLTEVDGGVLYLASLPSGATAGSIRDTLDEARDRGPVAAVLPDPVCPPIDLALIPTTPASIVAD